MHGAWVAFARDGDPGWPAYDDGRRAVMHFDEVSSVVDDPRGEERRLWEGNARRGGRGRRRLPRLHR